MFTFQSAIGHLERENTLQRSRDATLRLAREGAWLGGIVPFGYRVEGKERAARLVVSNEVNSATGLSEADVVRLIYRMAGEAGKSSIQIAEYLNELHIPTSYARDGREVVRNKRKEKTQDVWRGGRVRNQIHTWSLLRNTNNHTSSNSNTSPSWAGSKVCASFGSVMRRLALSRFRAR